MRLHPLCAGVHRWRCATGSCARPFIPCARGFTVEAKRPSGPVGLHPLCAGVHRSTVATSACSSRFIPCARGFTAGAALDHARRPPSSPVRGGSPKASASMGGCSSFIPCARGFTALPPTAGHGCRPSSPVRGGSPLALIRLPHWLSLHPLCAGVHRAYDCPHVWRTAFIPCARGFTGDPPAGGGPAQASSPVRGGSPGAAELCHEPSSLHPLCAGVHRTRACLLTSLRAFIPCARGFTADAPGVHVEAHPSSPVRGGSPLQLEGRREAPELRPLRVGVHRLTSALVQAGPSFPASGGSPEPAALVAGFYPFVLRVWGSPRGTPAFSPTRGGPPTPDRAGIVRVALSRSRGFASELLDTAGGYRV